MPSRCKRTRLRAVLPDRSSTRMCQGLIGMRAARLSVSSRRGMWQLSGVRIEIRSGPPGGGACDVPGYRRGWQLRPGREPGIRLLRPGIRQNAEGRPARTQVRQTERAMKFETVATGGGRSYLIGCEQSCAAVLIDPELSQIDRYIALAARDGLRI